MTNKQWLVPIDQDMVTFYNHSIVVVRLADGRICVILRWICSSLQLDPQSQVRRIRRTEAIADELLFVRVQTEGGDQVLPALTLRALPFWLAGIDIKRVADADMRSRILTYQREVVDVLYRHFAKRKRPLSDAQALVPSEAMVRPAQPTRDAPASEWLNYHEQMALWWRWQEDIERWREEVEQWQGSMESRMESVEEVTRLVPEILERFGPETLSPEHQRTVQASVNRLHDLTGRSHAAIYDELREAFHVARYSDIPESRWTEVATWFQTRIKRAQGK